MTDQRNRNRERALAQFKQIAAPATAAERAQADYAAEGDALRTRTEKLKAERMARESTDGPPQPPAPRSPKRKS